MTVSRRSLLGLAAASAAIVVAAPALAQGVAIRSVKIDTSGIAQRGLSNYAVKIQGLAQAAVPKSFAGLVGQGSATLVIRFDQISLAANPMGTGRGALRDDPLDFAVGSWALVDAKGAVIKGDKLTANLSSTYAAPWFVEDNQLERERAIVEAFLYWVRRAL